MSRRYLTYTPNVQPPVFGLSNQLWSGARGVYIRAHEEPHSHQQESSPPSFLLLKYLSPFLPLLIPYNLLLFFRHTTTPSLSVVHAKLVIMTEYDYSPEAHQAFKNKLRGVGKWAQQQAKYSNSYPNPFVPSDYDGHDANTLTSSRARGHHDTRHHDESPSFRPDRKSVV